MKQRERLEQALKRIGELDQIVRQLEIDKAHYQHLAALDRHAAIEAQERVFEAFSTRSKGRSRKRRRK